MHLFRRSLRTLLVASAGVATALGVASLTQTASGQDDTSTSTSTSTSTTKTTTTTTTATTTTTTPKAKPKAVKKTLTCKGRQYATRLPVSSSLEFATLSCSSPLGKGVRQNSATVARGGDATKATFSGSIKLFFNTATLRGTFKTDSATAGSTVRYDGTIAITSGTGEFKGRQGHRSTRRAPTGSCRRSGRSSR